MNCLFSSKKCSRDGWLSFDFIDKIGALQKNYKDQITFKNGYLIINNFYNWEDKCINIDTNDVCNFKTYIDIDINFYIHKNILYIEDDCFISINTGTRNDEIRIDRALKTDEFVITPEKYEENLKRHLKREMYNHKDNKVCDYIRYVLYNDNFDDIEELSMDLSAGFDIKIKKDYNKQYGILEYFYKFYPEFSFFNNTISFNTHKKYLLKSKKLKLVDTDKISKGKITRITMSLDNIDRIFGNKIYLKKIKK